MKLKFCFASAVLGLTIFRAYSATFTVTHIGDSGFGSLRQAILDANAANGDDTITFAIGGTITLGTSLPAVSDSTTIEGPGTNQVMISGNGLVNIFTFNNGTTNTISGLTISDGMAINYANGAGIANAGKLTLITCAFVNNRNFGGWGGAVFNSGGLVIKDSAFLRNQVTGENGYVPGGGGGAGMGGAVFTMLGGVLISNCNFSSNSAMGGNGASGASNGIGRGGGTNAGLSEFNKNGGFGGGGCGFPPCCKAGDGGFGGGGGGSNTGGSGGLGGGTGNGGCINVNPGGGGGGGGLGGGIFVHSGSVTIIDCRFVGNEVAGGIGGTDFCAPARSGSPGTGIGPDFYNFEGTILPLLRVTTLGGGSFITNPVSPPYLNQSLVTVTASPAPGWTFLHWLGDASGTNPVISLHMNRNKVVQAAFGRRLNLAPMIGIAPQTILYPYGTPVRLTAPTPPGFYFVTWILDVRGPTNPMTFVVSGSVSNIGCVLAPLDLGESSLNVIESGRGHVMIAPAKNRYAINETARLTAIPEAGQDFLGWSGDSGGRESPLVVPMTQSKVITANFTKRPTLRVGTPLEGLVEDGFRLTLQGEFGTRYSILGSTNLFDWIEAGTVTNIYGTAQLTDSAGTYLPRRFYRAVAE